MYAALRSNLLRRKNFFFIYVIIPLMFLQGCNSTSRSYDTLPKNLEDQVQMPEFPNVRTWADVPSKSFQQSAIESLQQEKTANNGKLKPEIDILAISGGGADGAFGAGLLYGWTKTGHRPQFKLVTGISTGALMAPFAFLGPSYDENLKKAYTNMSDNNIDKPHNHFSLLLAFANIRPLPSLASDKPLQELIVKLIDKKVLAEIAIEHKKGRRLLVGTTQLNAQRLVVWDMGAIAASDFPNKLKLFHKILLASASLPIFFPPQNFTVEAAHQMYNEMHVDGGVEAQVMLFESILIPISRNYKLLKGRKIRLYVIRNKKVISEFQPVKPEFKDIAIHTINSIYKSQGTADLYRLYVYAQRDLIDYNLAYIPDNFTRPTPPGFDNNYMKNLFDCGYDIGKSGGQWKKYPPGLF